MSFRIRINKKNFAKTLESTLSTRKVRNLAYNRAVEIGEKVRDEMIQKFEEHPVTQEVEGGPNSPNLSGVIKGDGNLYSFIGFSSPDNPLTALRTYLKTRGHVYRNSKTVKGINKINFVFRVQGPDKTTIENLTPLPYEKGLSWVRGIEKGISNIGHYIYKRVPSSNSGMGTQTEGKLSERSRPRAVSFAPKPYMSEIVNYFAQRLKGIK